MNLICYVLLGGWKQHKKNLSNVLPILIFRWNKKPLCKWSLLKRVWHSAMRLDYKSRHNHILRNASSRILIKVIVTLCDSDVRWNVRRKRERKHALFAQIEERKPFYPLLLLARPPARLSIASSPPVPRPSCSFSTWEYMLRMHG